MILPWAYEGFIIGLSALILGYVYIKIGVSFIFKIINSNPNSYELQELSFQEVLNTGALVFILIVLSVILAIYPILRMDISTTLSNEK